MPWDHSRRCSQNFAAFGEDARIAAKLGGGTARFWFLMVVSSLYFSGLMHHVDYLCRFPGHNPTLPSPVNKGLDAVMTILGQCFNKTYWPDLIVRHTASQKSQPILARNRTFQNHLNTLHLNRFPHPNGRKANQAPVSLRGKKVLVVDDICTSGRSLDVARAYIEAAGGQAILFSWLKTVNTAFMHMTASPVLLPYQAAMVASEPPATAFPYYNHIIDHQAPQEIDARLATYKAWSWP